MMFKYMKIQNVFIEMKILNKNKLSMINAIYVNEIQNNKKELKIKPSIYVMRLKILHFVINTDKI